MNTTAEHVAALQQLANAGGAMPVDQLRCSTTVAAEIVDAGWARGAVPVIGNVWAEITDSGRAELAKGKR